MVFSCNFEKRKSNLCVRLGLLGANQHANEGANVVVELEISVVKETVVYFRGKSSGAKQNRSDETEKRVEVAAELKLPKQREGLCVES